MLRVSKAPNFCCDCEDLREKVERSAIYAVSPSSPFPLSVLAGDPSSSVSSSAPSFCSVLISVAGALAFFPLVVAARPPRPLAVPLLAFFAVTSLLLSSAPGGVVRFLEAPFAVLTV